MFTDTVGFTASTQANEGRTIELLREQSELLHPLVALHQGREIKSTGDGFLVEFDSALKAVQCAIGIQRRLFERNAEANFAPIRIRIGVHLGDVIQNGSDILGDAVNLAARIEPFAEPGGICVSGAVYDQVRSKVPDKFEKLAPKAMKGVQVPLEVYRVLLPWMGNGAGGADGESAPLDQHRIAILPFANISPDAADEYFADGLTEELIANLSLVAGLKVIARTSVIGYKKTDKKVAAIGRELGVGTVVEGSVRRAANRIRVTVQVIDVATEEHLWTAKYDDDLDDIFAVQSDIAQKVVTSLPGSLERARAPTPALEKPAETEAYLAYLQGQSLMWKSDETSLRKSLDLFQQALKSDPTFARAYAGTARAYIGLGTQGYIPWMDSIRQGIAAAERAIAMDPELAEAHGLRAELAFMGDDLAGILYHEVTRALELNPNLAQAHSMLSALAGTLGLAETLVSQAEEAYHLDPLSPATIRDLGNAYFYTSRIEDAVAHWKKNLKQNPIESHRGLADYYMLTGEFEKAEEMVRAMESFAPTDGVTLLCRGCLAAKQGDRAKAMQVIAKLTETFRGGYSRQSFVGFIYYALGDLDRYFEYMRVAAEAHTLQLLRIRFSPLLTAGRKDTRLVELLATYTRPPQNPK
jgi:adenylate cyclase